MWGVKFFIRSSKCKWCSRSSGHNATLHSVASTYKPVYGLQYKTPLTGSAKNLKISISIQSNGYDASLQDLTLLHKQGKIR